MYDRLIQLLEEEGLTLEDFLYSLDFIIAVAVIVIFLVLLVVLRLAVRRHIPKKTLESHDYEREIPEGWTPAEMCPLFYNFKKTVYVDESISATILDLTRRGFIEVEPDEDKKNADLRLTDKPRVENTEFTDDEGRHVTRTRELLKPHELKLIDLLDDVVPQGQWFSMKDFEEYCKRNQQATAKKIDDYRKLAEAKTENLGCYVAKGKNGSKNLATTIGAIAVVVGLAIVLYAPDFVLWTGLAFIFGGGILLLGSYEPRRLTKVGVQWYLYFHAMEDFFTDFTMLDERELPDLVLWEEYMVFATAMGVADKVAKNLEIAYPKLKEERKAGTAASRGNYDPFVAYLVFKGSGRIVQHATRTIINTAGKFATRFSASGLTRVFGNGGANIGKTINVLGKLMKRK